MILSTPRFLVSIIGTKLDSLHSLDSASGFEPLGRGIEALRALFLKNNQEVFVVSVVRIDNLEK